ncbi:uncharacterized protein LOC113168619 isoform X2 [Anabas testudineus]|uniref:uncharacterized protein LOC113168619 isoform X2 n=1 Tax=Anabas testudineus TaxID=64144 RepID=UPI000E4599FB|nr:uncharacterized protein LOC113168619 isoform X2 [Anabas testudineus]
MEGEAVTLRCRNKTSSSQTSADFYHYGSFIGSSSTGNMSIHSVSKSNGGPYKCNISGAGESAESRLTVRGGQKEAVTFPYKETTTSPFKEMVTFSPSSNPWIILTVLFAILLVLVGLLHFVRSYWHRVYLQSPESGSTGNQLGTASVNPTTAVYGVVKKKKKEKDEGEASCRPIYSMLGLDDSQQLGFGERAD